MVELRTLGTLDVRGTDGASVDAILAQPKRAAILVYLVATTNERYVRRGNLFTLFWPEGSERRARGALRQSLYAIRQDLGTDLFETRGDDELRVTPGLIEADVHAFEAALAADDPKTAAELYEGSFLGGFHLRGHRQFEDWVEEERDRLARAYQTALETLVERAAASRSWEEGVRWARLLSRQNPYSTRVVLRYMEAMAAAGDRAGALKIAERHGAIMHEELGAAPSPDVEALAERLRKDPGRRHEEG